MDKSQTNNNGELLLGLLTIVFITLKLTNVIDWSWWWVFAPIWGIAVLYVILIFTFIVFGKVYVKTKEDDKSVTYRARESKFQTRMREMMEKERALNKK